MHYSCLIITKEFPTDEVLGQVLEPFDEEKLFEQPEESREYPPFSWDWWTVGGRYSGRLKLAIKANDEKYQWEYMLWRQPRNGRLFRSYLLDRTKGDSSYFHEENYFSSMGANDGFIYVDGALIDDIQNISDVTCYCCIDKDGNAYATESWNGSEWVENKQFEKQLADVIANSKGCYVCFVDIHD